MGNVQFLEGINPFENTDNITMSPDGYETAGSDYDFLDNDDMNSIISNNLKIACEYCQEYFFPQFHQQHVRICDCNPDNLRRDRNYLSRREGYSTQAQQSLNPELQKIPCEYCNELCYSKYQKDHQRICAKNPENIKINCRYCSKTLNLILYQSHLECCEESHKDRRRASLRPSRNHNRPSLADMRKIKTNTDIEMECCKGVKRGGLDKDRQVECPICLENIKSTFDLTVLSCNHKFHRGCLNKWSIRQKKCPMCRKEFF